MLAVGRPLMDIGLPTDVQLARLEAAYTHREPIQFFMSFNYFERSTSVTTEVINP